MRRHPWLHSRLFVLRRSSHSSKSDVMQKWFADDGNVVGSLTNLRKILDVVETTGKGFGYLLEPSKCHLVCKPEYVEEAKEIFRGTNFKIVEGHRILGSTIGTKEAVEAFIDEQCCIHKTLIDKLEDIAKTTPKTYTHAIQKEYSRS